MENGRRDVTARMGGSEEPAPDAPGDHNPFMREA